MRALNAGLYAIVIAMLVLSSPMSVLAGDLAVVPEIDGKLLSAGLVALTGGVLVLRARFGRK